MRLCIRGPLINAGNNISLLAELCGKLSDCVVFVTAGFYILNYQQDLPLLFYLSLSVFRLELHLFSFEQRFQCCALRGQRREPWA